MSTSEKQAQPAPSFLEKLKAALITFLAGAATGGAAVGYVIMNAEQYNLPFLSRGNNNTQTTDISKAQSSGTNTGNVGTNP